MFFNMIELIIVFVCALVRLQLFERFHAIFPSPQPEKPFYILITVFHLCWSVEVFNRKRKLEVMLVR